MILPRWIQAFLRLVVGPPKGSEKPPTNSPAGFVNSWDEKIKSQAEVALRQLSAQCGGATTQEATERLQSVMSEMHRSKTAKSEPPSNREPGR